MPEDNLVDFVKYRDQAILEDEQEEYYMDIFEDMSDEELQLALLDIIDDMSVDPDDFPANDEFEIMFTMDSWDLDEVPEE